MPDNPQNNNCRIVVDAMGGDFAPENVVEGALQAFSSQSFQLILVGKENEIKSVIEKKNLNADGVTIINADEVIGMSEGPTQALRSKPNSSIVIGTDLVKDGKAEAFVSAGNTGAVMAAGTLIIGRIKGAGRPTIGAKFPTADGRGCYLYDVGASVDSKAEHIREYAVMGSIYAEVMDGIKNPSVGLLSVGEEEKKGNNLTSSSFGLLKDADINFIGNVEGRDILGGKADIILCDGFLGNVILKFGESFLKFLKGKLTIFAEKGIVNKLKALVVKITLKEALKDMDYQSHGGVPLLGVKGVTIIGHGSSSALAIKNMVLKAKEMIDKDLVKKLEESLSAYV